MFQDYFSHALSELLIYIHIYIYVYIYIFSNSDVIEFRYKMVRLLVDNLIRG